MAIREKLPEGFNEIYAVDLQKDKKMAALINVVAVVISVAFGLAGHFFVHITTLFDMSYGFAAYTIRFVSLFILLVLYIILHELVHGVTMKAFGTRKVKYGFTGMYAFAASDDYYDKKSYVTIALAPIVVWGVVLAIICFYISREWFWVVYFIQIANLSGAAGDLFVTLKFSRMPKDILIHDSGVGMTVYSKEKYDEN